MYDIRAIAAILLLSLTISGCASSGPVGPLQTAGGASSSVQLASGDALPAPTSADYSETYRPYQIGPFDELDIGVFGIPEMQQRTYRADASARISFPLIGTIDAGGMTPPELEQAITTRLRSNYVRDPQVFVNLKESASRTVTVAGQVAKPGMYPVLGKMTLVRSVAVAGGLDDFAKTNEILVFRTVRGQRMAAIYDLGGIHRGNYDDPEIYPNDVIVVGDSPQKRAIRDVVGTAPAILAPLLVTLLQR